MMTGTCSSCCTRGSEPTGKGGGGGSQCPTLPAPAARPQTPHCPQAGARWACGQDSCSLTSSPRFSQFQAPRFQAGPVCSVALLPVRGPGRSPAVRRGSQALQADGGCSWRTRSGGPSAGCRPLEGLRPLPDSGAGPGSRETISRTTSRSLTPTSSSARQQNGHSVGNPSLPTPGPGVGGEAGCPGPWGEPPPGRAKPGSRGRAGVQGSPGQGSCWAEDLGIN